MPSIWSMRWFHYIPFTNYEVIGNMYGVPVLGVYYIAFLCGLIYLVFMYFYTKEKYGNYLYTKFGYILLGGKFNEGKTRLLAQFARDIYERANTFVLSNFYNGYSFISWSSFEDFCNLLDDLLTLGEYQNFTKEESAKIEEKFPGYFCDEWVEDTEDEKKKKVDSRIGLKKYKYIPCDGKTHCDFLLEGDEFHQYLYSRDAISNFSGEKGKKLLQTMHQVRHYNTLCALATQDLDDLDVKLRRLASYEIDTVNYFGLFFGYNFFHYLLNKRRTKEHDDAREYRKMHKFPILFPNTYAMNFIIDDFEKILNTICVQAVNFYNKKLTKNYIFKKIQFKRFKTLDFETKFNVKLDKNIYKKGDLFKKLNEYYKKNGQ